jgi:hypothetical protein
MLTPVRAGKARLGPSDLQLCIHSAHGGAGAMLRVPTARAGGLSKFGPSCRATAQK